LPHPDPGWPHSVQALYEALTTRLFRQGVYIGHLRDELNLPRYTAARFRYHVGTTPKTFLVHHRMEVAKRLLKQHGLPVMQVAFEVGYARPNSFSSVFKRHVGVAPSVWRGNA
jgi:AraC family transcriptional regulator